MAGAGVKGRGLMRVRSRGEKRVRLWVNNTRVSVEREREKVWGCKVRGDEICRL